MRGSLIKNAIEISGGKLNSLSRHNGPLSVAIEPMRHQMSDGGPSLPLRDARCWVAIEGEDGVIGRRLVDS
jgi:hypothetical protein